MIHLVMIPAEELEKLEHGLDTYEKAYLLVLSKLPNFKLTVTKEEFETAQKEFENLHIHSRYTEEKIEIWLDEPDSEICRQ